MFCRYCGKENPDDAVFCAFCGKPTVMNNASHRPQKATAAKKNGGSRKWIVLLLCLLLILGGMMAYMRFGTIVTIPDPGQFMGLSSSKPGNSSMGTHKHTATVQNAQDYLSDVQEYVEYLEDRCDMDITWESQKPSTILGNQYVCRYSLEYDGFWIPLLAKPSLSVDYYTIDNGGYYCTVHYDRTVRLKDYIGANSQSSQSTRQETEPTEATVRQETGQSEVTVRPEQTVSVGTQLPSFLGIAEADGFYVDSFYADTAYSYDLQYYTESHNNFDVVQQYVDILTDTHGCKIVHHDSSSGKDWGSETWYMEHPCTDAEPRDIGRDVGIEGNIWIHYMEIDGMESALSIIYVNPLKHADADGREFSDDIADPFKQENCWICGNDGRCDICGGSGWVNTWTGDSYVTQNCTAAFCRGGSCTECDGRGYN